MHSHSVTTWNRALKLAILDSGQTQRRLAKAARIDETRLSRLIRGQAIWFPYERKAVAKALKCSEAELFHQSEVSA